MAVVNCNYSILQCEGSSNISDAHRIFCFKNYYFLNPSPESMSKILLKPSLELIRILKQNGTDNLTVYSDNAAVYVFRIKIEVHDVSINDLFSRLRLSDFRYLRSIRNV